MYKTEADGTQKGAQLLPALRPTCVPRRLSSFEWRNHVCLALILLLWSFHLAARVSSLHCQWRLGIERSRSLSKVSPQTWRRMETNLGWRVLFCGEVHQIMKAIVSAGLTRLQRA